MTTSLANGAAAGTSAPCRPIKVAIVGAGWMGELHAECISASGEAEVVAVVDLSTRSMDAFVTRFGAAVPYDSLTTMLDKSDASVVAICTPSGLHARQSIQSMQAGRHVVVEKPLATRVSEGTAMVRAAHNAGVTLSVIMQYRFNRDALRLKRAVERGLFGDVLFVNVTNHISRDNAYFATNGGWRGTWDLNGGGVLINQTTHGMDLLDWCMGPISSAAGAAATRRQLVEVEDTIDATVTFPNGAMGHVQATTAGHSNNPLRLEIIGTKGSAMFERARLTRWEPAEDVELLTAEEQTQLPVAPDDVYGEEFGIAHRRQYSAILQALHDGEQPPVSGEEALSSLRTIAAIYAHVCGPTIKPEWVDAEASHAV